MVSVRRPRGAQLPRVIGPTGDPAVDRQVQALEMNLREVENLIAAAASSPTAPAENAARILAARWVGTEADDLTVRAEVDIERGAVVRSIRIAYRSEGEAEPHAYIADVPAGGGVVTWLLAMSQADPSPRAWPIDGASRVSITATPFTAPAGGGEAGAPHGFVLGRPADAAPAMRYADGAVPFASRATALGYGLTPTAADGRVQLDVGRDAAVVGSLNGSYQPDFRITGIARVTMVGDLTLELPLTATDGVFVLLLTQDAVGEHLLHMGANMKLAAGSLNPAPGAETVATIIVAGGTGRVALIPVPS